MYLSRLILNPRSRAVRRDLADCYDMHRTVLSCFRGLHDAFPRLNASILYRVDTEPRSARVSLLIQSAARPEFTHLPAGYLSTDEEENPACKPLDDAYDGLRMGAILSFRLRANATRRLADSGKRVEIVGETNQVRWLRRKSDEHGFELRRVSADSSDVVPIREGKHGGWRSSGSARTRLTFGSVRFEGILVVRDIERFRSCLEHGLGSAKAFGFGLLSIAPARPYEGPPSPSKDP